jgi:hypothetical protein
MADYVQIPKEIMSLNRNVTLAIDIMFINGLPFMVSISRKIKFTTVEYLLGRKHDHLVKSIRKIINLYRKRGFTVDTALMDREFECLRADLHELNLKTTAASEHVPDVERQIRVLKERSRAIRRTLPFNAIPGRIIIELVYYAAFWLNDFPHQAECRISTVRGLSRREHHWTSPITASSLLEHMQKETS